MLPASRDKSHKNASGGETMTRGRLVLITDEYVFVSTEFNGGMYFGGHGEEAMEAIRDVRTVDEFRDAICAFNKKYFGYNETREEMERTSPPSGGSPLRRHNGRLKEWKERVH